MKNNKVATTVKLEPMLYDKFKVLGILNRQTLQDLVERCVFRYVNEDLFRNEMNNYKIPPTVTAVPEPVSNAVLDDIKSIISDTLQQETVPVVDDSVVPTQ